MPSESNGKNGNGKFYINDQVKTVVQWTIILVTAAFAYGSLNTKVEADHERIIELELSAKTQLRYYQEIDRKLTECHTDVKWVKERLKRMK